MSTPEATRQPPSGLVVVLGSLTALGPLSIDAYLPALPTLEAELGAAPGAGALTLSTYFLGLAGAQVPWGLAADRIGRRPPLLVGLALYVLGSIACGFASDLRWLAAARLLQGVGAAASLVVTRTLARDLWSGRDVARVMSLITLVMGVAPVVAPLVGGALLRFVSWRAIFAFLAVMGVLFIALSALRIPETRRAGAPEPWLTGLRALARDRAFVSFSLAAGASSAAMFAYIAGSPDVFVRQLGVAPLVYSLCFGANAACLVAVSQANRALLTHRSPHTLASFGATGLVLGSGALLLIAWLAPSPFTIEPLLLVLLGLQGLLPANLVALALDAQAPRAGLASAVLGTVQFAVSSLASATVAASANGTAVPMATAMLVCALVALGLLLARR